MSAWYEKNLYTPASCYYRVLGAGLVVLVGSMRFDVDNKAFHKALHLKHKVERKAPAL